MAQAQSADELGPVDYLVVEFPGSKFNGEIAPQLLDLVDRGIIRVLDLVMIIKESRRLVRCGRALRHRLE